MHTLVKQYNSVAVQSFRPVAIKCLYNIVLRIVSSCNLSESSDRHTSVRMCKCLYVYNLLIGMFQQLNELGLSKSENSLNT